jgi:NIMA (never in mitosis gene a)-related kinase
VSVSGRRPQWVLKEVELQDMDAKGRRDALREIGYLGSMDSPYVVAYREHFQSPPRLRAYKPQQQRLLQKKNAGAADTGGDILYIIMEYADGGCLGDRIKAQRASNRPFPEALVVSWLVQIALALKHLHDRKLIHRDIKADNVFLTSTNRVKIGDFGIAKDLDFTMQQAKTRIGTPFFLSPEICQNQAYDAKTDMWSLGVVLYELLTLQLPFVADSMEKL